MRRVLLVFLSAVSFFAIASDVDNIKSILGKALPGAVISDVRPSPVAGIYEAEASGQIVYVSADGKYLFTGDLIDVNARVNLTEQLRERKMVAAIEALGTDKMIVMGPAKPKHTITVFTDVDCPYCAKLHLEVPELNKNGVQVRYIFFPRAGENSDSFKKSVAVWCAKNRVDAIGAAKAGRKIEMKTCPNPVLEHLKLAQSLSVRGTPTIISRKGTVVPGYMPAARLLAMLQGEDEEQSTLKPK